MHGVVYARPITIHGVVYNACFLRQMEFINSRDVLTDAGGERLCIGSVQGYLVHQKQHPPLGLSYGPRLGPTAEAVGESQVSGRGRLAQPRGTERERWCVCVRERERESARGGG